MLMHDVFPGLANQMQRDLGQLRRFDLAEQVMKLNIVDRCRCGLEACGTFYTEEVESRKLRLRYRTYIMLRCGANVTEAGGRILEVETLDPAVEAQLRRLIP
jgi:hypothetical protein